VFRSRGELCYRSFRRISEGKAAMALVKLRKANEAGEDAGAVIINPEQIVSISAGPNVTEIQTADGHTHWVMETPDQVAALVKSSS
jgi:hypothetical protein